MGYLACIMGALMALAVTLNKVDAQQPQQPQQPPVPGQCAENFDQQLSPRCFEPFNLTFQGVLLLITRNMSGELPPGETVASYRAKTCTVEQLDNIIPCILQFKAGFTNTTCTQEEFNMIDQSGRQLLRMTEGMCAEPCEQQVEERLQACFVQSRIQPGPYLNTSLVHDKYLMLGNTTEEADRFCSSRMQLFPCLQQVVNACPHAQRTMDEMGLDVDSYMATSEILCNERQRYFQSLPCFYSGQHNMTQCLMGTGQAMGAIMFARARTGQVKPSELVIRLCEVRMSKVACEMNVFNQPCQSHLGLRLATECSILPTICKQHEALQPILDRMCPAPTTPAQVPVTTKSPEFTTPRRPVVIPAERDPGAATGQSTGSRMAVSGLMSSVIVIVYALLL